MGAVLIVSFWMVCPLSAYRAFDLVRGGIRNRWAVSATWPGGFDVDNQTYTRVGLSIFISYRTTFFSEKGACEASVARWSFKRGAHTHISWSRPTCTATYPHATIPTGSRRPGPASAPPTLASPHLSINHSSLFLRPARSRGGEGSSEISTKVGARPAACVFPS